MTSDVLQEKIDDGRNNIAKAEREVRRLQEALSDGTLDRKKLELGLEELEATIVKLAAALPTFNK